MRIKTVNKQYLLEYHEANLQQVIITGNIYKYIYWEKQKSKAKIRVRSIASLKCVLCFIIISTVNTLCTWPVSHTVDTFNAARLGEFGEDVQEITYR